MLMQHEDGSHEISLHNIRRYGSESYPNANGVFRWSHDKGVRFEVEFPGIYSLTGLPYFVATSKSTAKVGRLTNIETSVPDWIAETEEGTAVQLFGVNETPVSTTHRGMTGSEVSCRYEGIAMYAVIEFSGASTLAFDNATSEDYRMFFTGSAGARHHLQESVEFSDQSGGVTTTGRCSIVLSEAPTIKLVNGNALIKCSPSGWLSFSVAPTKSDCEIGAFGEQTFVSFLNGDKIPFHWADRRIKSGVIRRTYFGWVKSRGPKIAEALRPPLPILNGIELFSHGDEVLALLPSFFESFIQKYDDIDFPLILTPLWTGTNTVLQDRLALASVSLERISSQWKSAKLEEIGKHQSVWKRRPLLKSLRKLTGKVAEDFLTEVSTLEQCEKTVIEKMKGAVRDFVLSDHCSEISELERQELQDVVLSRIGNLTGPPNSASLQQPYLDLGIELREDEREAIKKRNDALHGKKGAHGNEIDYLDQEAEFFDILSVLITKFVFALCGYEGPYIDYASRPSNGNFEVKRLECKTGQADASSKPEA